MSFSELVNEMWENINLFMVVHIFEVASLICGGYYQILNIGSFSVSLNATSSRKSPDHFSLLHISVRELM